MNTPLPSDCLHPTRTVVIIDILLRIRAAMHTTIAAAAVWQFVLLWGPLIVGAHVRPNMPNTPKSASANNLIVSNDVNTTWAKANISTA